MPDAATQATLTRAELETLAQRAGLTLGEDQVDELIAVYPKLRAMAERVRQPRGIAAEPALVFVAGTPAP